MPSLPVITNKISSILNLDIADLKSRRVELVVFDVEGTITEWRGSTVPDAYVKKLREIKKFAKLALATNMPPHRSHVAEQVGAIIDADYVATVKRFWHKKPRGYLLHACTFATGVDPNNAVMIGDKIVDAMSAKRAGFREAYIVDKYGLPDHPFDRLIVRPLQNIWHKLQ